MTQQAELLEKIDTLPPEYFGEVLDFVGYLQQKARLETAEEETERINHNARPALKNADEGVTSPVDALFALFAPIRGTVNIDEIRMERITSKHMKHLK